METQGPTIRPLPEKTMGDYLSRIATLDEPPDEFGPYSIAYDIKHRLYVPVKIWIEDEPALYLDSEHKVQMSSAHRDHLEQMAPVLGQIALEVVGVAGNLRSGASKGGKLVAGEGGRFASLDARAAIGDDLTPHHMPQAALGFTSRADGGALVMTAKEHAMTRTFGALGRVTARADKGKPFRDVLAQDMRNVRQIVGPKYDQGLQDLLKYYYDNFPELME